MKYTISFKIINSETDIINCALNNQGSIYTFLNPVSYLEAMRHKDMFMQFDGIYADGSILVKAIRILYGRKVTRKSFDTTSIAADVFDYATKEGKSIYIVSSEQNSVEKAVNHIKERFNGIQVIGYRNGFFKNEEEKDLEIRKIISLNPDYLIVGMGVIKQEEFLLRAKEAGYQGIGFTCGGFISQIAQNNIDYYPAWVDRMNVRFLYRMYKEPHTRKRYLKAGILFPIVFVKEKFFG